MVIESKLAIRISKETSNSQDVAYYTYTTSFVQDYAFGPRVLDITICYMDTGNNVKSSHSRACMTCYYTDPLLLVFAFCPPSIAATDWGRQVSKSTCSCFYHTCTANALRISCLLVEDILYMQI